MADILLIDDMAGVRRAIAVMLKGTTHTVTTAENGFQGLALLRSRWFDLVITDMRMPVLDGVEVLAALKTMARRPRVIAMSGGGAGAATNTALRAMRAGSDLFLEKPFEKQDLLDAVEQLLGATRMRMGA